MENKSLIYERLDRLASFEMMHGFVTKNKSYNLKGEYPYPAKQPWKLRTDRKEKPVLNLKINSDLVSILPNKFLLRNSISKKFLFYLYVEWYLKRRDELF